MKKNLRDYYSFHDKFILRTPVLPLKISKMSVEELFNYTKQPFFIEAVYLASPVLHNELIKWHHGKLSDKKKITRLISSLYKYYNRMQSRCTPYGLFAACSTGTWGEENNIQLNTKTKRHTRLDMNYLCALAQQLNMHEAILPRLQFYPNNSMYSFGGQLRYVEYNYVNSKRVHQLSSVTQSPYLQLLLEKAEDGLHIQQLCELLTDDEITYEEAEAFVHELIENQILVSELEPAVTGDEFIYQIINTLKKINSPSNNEIQAIIQLLEKTQNNIAVIDEKVGNPTSVYQDIYRELQTLNASIEENQLFQTDLYRIPDQASLNSTIKTNLAEAISFLNTLNITREDKNLKTFRDNFYSQYEDAEIPLLEALDTETGVGYKGKDNHGINLLLEDLHTNTNTESDTHNISWNKQEELLHKKLTDALKKEQYTVHFTAKDAEKTAAFSTALPNTFSMMFKVLNSDGRIYLQNCGGPSGAYLLGRFAHGDRTIHNMTTDITTHEQKLNPGKIYAEIVHLPESRIGNILLRPVLRNYEIPYLGKSALPKEQQIPLQDLYVSVRRNKILLRSKKHNKEIIPRLSTAHNYSYNALPAYQFLGDIQTQYTEKYSLGFSWGALTNMYTFLPRAEYKNVILAKARWQLRKKDFEIILQYTVEDDIQNINNWRTQLKMPDRVVLADTDNTLLINFEDPLSIKMLADTIKQRDTIILEEFLFNDESMFITDENDNRYTNECIAIVLKNEPGQDADHSINVSQNTENTTIQRDFAMGSEWLYYKFYCGIKTGDQLLADAIKPLTETLTAKKLIDKFFFLRYADPQGHIRLRFHLSDLAKLGEVVTTISKYVMPYLEKGLITKIQTDTYNRELERYGGNSMIAAESFFHIDSVITLQLLDAIEGDAGEEIRWQFGIRSVDELLDNFQYTLADKLFVLASLKNSFINEHGGHKELKQQLGTKYRKLRKPVEEILNRDLDGQREISPLIQLLAYKTEQMKPVAEAILKLKNNGELQLHLNDLMASFIHMLLNRLFKARQRTHEMVIYDFLHNHYKSVLARKKNKNKQSKNKGVAGDITP